MRVNDEAHIEETIQKIKTIQKNRLQEITPAEPA